MRPLTRHRSRRPIARRMFFPSILEVPCCKQSLCSFCLQEHIQKQQQIKSNSSNSNNGPAANGKHAAAMRSAHSLPIGVACPHCALPVKGAPRELRVLNNGEEPSARYVDSPRTAAEMARISNATAAGPNANSPLRVGDDHNALARKMLPFDAMVVVEESSAADDRASTGPSHADAAGVLPLMLSSEAAPVETGGGAAAAPSDDAEVSGPPAAAVELSAAADDAAAGPAAGSAAASAAELGGAEADGASTAATSLEAVVEGAADAEVGADAGQAAAGA